MLFCNVNVFQWNRIWLFSRHVLFDSGFHVMTVNKVFWDRPKIILGFTIMPCWVLSWLLKKTLLILLEDFPCSSPVSGLSGLRWMSSDPDLLQKFWLFNLRLGIWNYHHSWGVNTSFASSLRAWRSDASISSNSSMSATKMSPFQILPAESA